jgi:hypothetical protein
VYSHGGAFAAGLRPIGVPFKVSRSRRPNRETGESLPISRPNREWGERELGLISGSGGGGRGAYAPGGMLAVTHWQRTPIRVRPSQRRARANLKEGPARAGGGNSGRVFQLSDLPVPLTVCPGPGPSDSDSEQTRKSPACRPGTPVPGPGSRPNRETARFPIPDSRPIGSRESGNPPPKRENGGSDSADSRF